MTAPAGTEVTVLRTYEQFVAIAAEWQELFAAAERPTPYQRHSWLRHCWTIAWRHPLNRLRVVLVRRNGRLAMAGAFVLGWRRLRPIVYLLSSRTPQYDDLLWRPGPDIRADVALLLEALGGELRLPRQLKLDQVLEPSPLITYAGEQARAGVRSFTRTSHIPLHQFEGYDAYFESLSRNLRVDHRRRLRRLADLHAEVEIRGGADRAEVVAWTLDRKRAWLTETGKQAAWLRGGRVDAMFGALLAENGDSPDLWASSIRVDGRIIAGGISLVEGDTLYYSKITHDPAYGKHSPARTLTLLIIREALEAGLRWFDLGQGNTAWKHRFTSASLGVARARIRLG